MHHAHLHCHAGAVKWSTDPVYNPDKDERVDGGSRESWEIIVIQETRERTILTKGGANAVVFQAGVSGATHSKRGGCRLMSGTH
jgi:hypothetical protein